VSSLRTHSSSSKMTRNGNSTRKEDSDKEEAGNRVGIASDTITTTTPLKKLDFKNEI